MIEKFLFYFRHSANDLRVNKRLTFFALLSIAAGVAAIVSLQTLAVMIGDTLSQNLQETNRGDISVQISALDGDAINQGVNESVLEQMAGGMFGGAPGDTVITASGLEAVQNWLTESPFAGEIDLTYKAYMSGLMGVFLGNGTGTAMTAVTTGNDTPNLSPIMVQTDVYPFYSQVMTLDGQSLTDAIRLPQDVVVSQTLARNLDVRVGDMVRINGASADFTVRGIVDDSAEIKGMQDIMIGLFGVGGYYYIDTGALQFFDNLSLSATDLYFKLNNPDDLAAFNTALTERFPYFKTMTTEDVRANNEQISDQIGQLVTILGLISLLVGSIGIVNTMQVIVRRRTVEVAVLKTIGLQANQVTLLFLTEAFIMGIIGSLVGIVLGWATTFLIKGAAEAAFNSTLPFRIAAGPAVNGLVVGVLVTTVFGFLPTLVAGQVRPGIVLRPQDNVVPRAGLLRSLLALLVIMVVLTVIAQSILSDFKIAVILVVGSFIAAGILYVMLLGLIWLVGRLFPSLGIVDLKIALRQMLAGRRRGAVTLLALVIGVFSLSLITLFADSINNLLRTLMEQQGNVLIQVQSKGLLDQTLTLLDSTEGVHSYSTSRSYSLEFVSWHSSATGETYDKDAVLALAAEQPEMGGFVMGSDADQASIRETILLRAYSALEVRPTDQPSDFNIVDGRQIEPSDAGNPVMVANQVRAWQDLGLQAGDQFTFNIVTSSMMGQGAGEQITFDVIGIADPNSMSFSFNPASVFVPDGALPPSVAPSSIQILVDMDEEQFPALRRELPTGTFALPTSIFTRLIESLLGTFIAFPTLAAALGLIVGGVVIANSVALTTMERRQEIAVMKAVGLQRSRVLGMLLLENSILGLIGGLIGVGIGLVSLVIMTSAAQMPGDTVPIGTGLLLMGLCIAVALIAALTSAWGASGEKPLNVLRYD